MVHPILSTDNAALQPFLKAAYELGASAAVSSPSSSAATTTTIAIRSLVLKLLSTSEIFSGYDQIKALLLPALQQRQQEQQQQESSSTPSSSAVDGRKIVETLDLFSYGRYHDYVMHQTTDRYLPLSDSHLFKLRQLTILSIVHDACSSLFRNDLSSNPLVGATMLPSHSMSIPYSTFQLALQLSNEREVEEMLVSCLYSYAITGQLCQKSQSLLLTLTSDPKQGGLVASDVSMDSSVVETTATTTSTTAVSDVVADTMVLQLLQQQTQPWQARDVPMQDLNTMLSSIRVIQQRIATARHDWMQKHAQVEDQQQQQQEAILKLRKNQGNHAAEDQCGGGGAGYVSSSMAGAFGAVDPTTAASVAIMNRSARRQKRSRGGLGGV